MAGRGPAPDPDRLRSGAPSRGEWQPSPDGGWQHDLPEPPVGISPAAVEVWGCWFRAWWAGNWTPDDVPALLFVIRLWDRVNRGDVKRAGELRQWMDGYGLTPKGQMDRRWRRPDPPRPKTALERIRDEAAAARNGTRAAPGTRGRPREVQGPASSRFKTLMRAEPPGWKDRFGTIELEPNQQPYRSRFETVIEPEGV